MKKGIAEEIKNGEFYVIRASLLDGDRALDEVLGCEFADFITSVAIETGSKDIVDIMIEEFGVNINEEIDGMFALFHAIEHERLDMVEFLLQKGADIEAVSDDGINSLCKLLKLVAKILLKFSLNMEQT